MREEPVRLGEESVVVVATVVDRAGDPARVGHAVLLLGHGPQLGEDALVRTRLRGDPMVRLEPVAVGVEVDQGSEVLGFLGHRVLLLEAWDRRDALRRPRVLDPDLIVPSRARFGAERER